MLHTGFYFRFRYIVISLQVCFNRIQSRKDIVMTETLVRILTPAVHDGAINFCGTQTLRQRFQYATIDGSIVYQITLCQSLQCELTTRKDLIDGGCKCPELCARF